MESFTRAEVAAYYRARVPTLAQGRGKEWRGPCPVHKGERDSFAVASATGRAYCHSACDKGWDIIGLEEALTGRPFKEARAEVFRIVGRPSSNGNRPGYSIVAEYDYTDSTGKTVFTVERHQRADGEKDFKVRHPGLNGRPIWKKPPIADSLPYRLHVLVGADTVYVVEGDKDVHTLEAWGFAATTNAFGARKWKKGHAEHLRGKHVIILPDNDDEGRAHADIVRETLRGIAASMRVVNLPGLPEKGDVTDWKENGGTAEQLRVIVENSAAPPEAATVEEGSRKFRSDDTGLYAEVAADGKTRMVRVGPRLDVIARTRNFDGEACGKQVHFRNWDGQERTCIIPLASLVGDARDGLDRLLNLGYQPSRDRKSIEAVKDFIYQTNPDRFIRCVTTVGWHSSEYFVLPDRTIAPKQSSEEIVFQPDSPTEHKYRSKGTLESWRQNVSLWCAGNSRLAFAVSAAFAAPLLDLLKSEGGGIHFRGLSSTGKTTAVLVAGSVWGGSPQLGFLETWRATANGIEARAALHNHALLCLDEIGEITEKEAGETVYALANGCGRGRMTRSLTSRPTSHFKLIFLSTGERTLHEIMHAAGKQVKGGQEVRLLEIPADAGRGVGLFEAIHTFPSPAAMADELARAAKNHYGTAIQPFLEHVINHRDTVTAIIRRCRDDFVKRHAGREDSGEVHRAATLFGLITAAGELASELGITGWEAKESLRAADSCFAAWIENRGGTGARDVHFGIEALRAFIQTHGASRFQDISEQEATIRDRAGFKERTDDGFRYFIFPHAFKNEICRGYDYQAVARELIALKFMQAQGDESGRLTFKKRIGRSTEWFFVVHPTFFSAEKEPGE